MKVKAYHKILEVIFHNTDHHFVFGNENGAEYMASMQKNDFADHSKHLVSNKIDSKGLRVSHFQLGDKSQAPSDQYETTYGVTMVNRGTGKENSRMNKNWGSSVVINGDGKNAYNTETQSK